ncbi:MAG: hypothetical protein WCX22_08410 [Methanoregula sp.]
MNQQRHLNKITAEDKNKILPFVIEEWRPTIDLAHWADMKERNTAKVLKQLFDEGIIERMWDGYLGKYYWRRLT